MHRLTTRMIDGAYRRVVAVATLMLLIAATVLAGPPASEPLIRKQPIPGTAVTLEMVEIPGGEVDGRTVAAFAMSRTEIPWDLYDIFVYRLDESTEATDAVTRPSKPYISMDRGFGHRGYAAISMSDGAARAFCRWLSVKTGVEYRLPTVAEWTHACSLGGVDEKTIGDHAWYRQNARHRAHPVGRKKPDAAGLHDLRGNASEWCIDDEGRPVTMGGSYKDRAEALGCASLVEPSRDWNDSDPQIPKSRWWLADGGFVGMRVVATIRSEPEVTAPEGEARREQPAPRETDR